MGETLRDIKVCKENLMKPFVKFVKVFHCQTLVYSYTNYYTGACIHYDYKYGSYIANSRDQFGKNSNKFYVPS